MIKLEAFSKQNTYTTQYNRSVVMAKTVSSKGEGRGRGENKYSTVNEVPLRQSRLSSIYLATQ